MGRLLLLFLLVPTIELILLLKVGSLIGVWPTVGIILATGVAGAALARHQGLAVLRRLQVEVAEGKIPGGPIFDGVMILTAGALLLTPGFVTDVFGLLCLVPATRAGLKRLLWWRVVRAVTRGRVSVFVSGAGPGGTGPV